MVPLVWDLRTAFGGLKSVRLTVNWGSEGAVSEPHHKKIHLCSGVSRTAPRVGFEPTTLRLTAGCSTIELPRNFLL